MRIMNKLSFAVLMVFGFVLIIILNTKAGEIKKQVAVSNRYLLAFHACNNSSGTVDCGPPTNHFTYLAQSNDGLNWSLVSSGAFPFQGSVPDIIQRGNYLYIYTPGVVKKYNITTNAIESTSAVTILDENGNREDFVDPSPILESDGRISLFYLFSGTSVGSDPAMCMSGETACTKLFRSATEVAGSDGTRFQTVANDRASVQIAGTATDAASDPDIFAGSSSGYYLYISRGNSTQVLTSNSLHGSYIPVLLSSSGILADNVGGVPAGHFDTGTNQYWTYTHTGMLGQNLSIRRATHSDFNTQLTDANFTTVISGTGIGLGNTFDVASPGFLEFDSTLAIGNSSGNSSSTSSGGQSSSSSGSISSSSSSGSSSTSTSSGSPSVSITGNSVIDLNGASSATEMITVTANGFNTEKECALITSKQRVISLPFDSFSINDPENFETINLMVKGNARRVSYPATVTIRVACRSMGESMSIMASLPITVNP